MKLANEIIGCAICAIIATGIIMFVAMGWHSLKQISDGSKTYLLRHQQASFYTPKPDITTGE